MSDRQGTPWGEGAPTRGREGSHGRDGRERRHDGETDAPVRGGAPGARGGTGTGRPLNWGAPAPAKVTPRAQRPDSSAHGARARHTARDGSRAAARPEPRGGAVPASARPDAHVRSASRRPLGATGVPDGGDLPGAASAPGISNAPTALSTPSAPQVPGGQDASAAASGWSTADAVAAQPGAGAVAPRPAPSPEAGMARAESARIGALDGLRALAIVSIVLYHLGVGWLPSGHMGVVMFLVLTGYLVTCSLMRSWARRGQVSPRAFMLRRLRRIWPSMAVTVVVVLLVCIVCNHVLLTKARPDAIPSLLFFSNWAYIVSGSSYFSQIGGPSPLTHLWYLSVDAQFCLAWSVVTWLAMRGGDRRVALRRGALAGAAVSAFLMGVLYVPDADPSRVYYGTDTRAFSLLMGAWLALAWPMGSRPAPLRGILWRTVSSADDAGEAPAARATVGAGALGVACLAGLVVIMVAVQPTATFLFRGGMALASLLVVGLIASVLTPGTPVGALLGSRPATWLGERAFALYLWHYPVFALTGASVGAWWLQVLATAASLGLAELSLRLVERPWADGRAAALARDTVAALRAGSLRRRGAHYAVGTGAEGDAAPSRGDAARGLVVAGVGAGLVVVAVLGCLLIPDEYLVPPSAIRNTGSSAAHGMDLTGRARPGASQASDAASASAQADVASTGTVDAGAASGDASGDAASPVVPATGSITLHAAPDEVAAGVYDPVMIGDSVPGDASDYFAEHVPDGLLDSYVGRKPDEMLQVLEDYLSQGIVGHVVVLQAFSNNVVTAEELDQMVADCGPDREIYLVNVRIPEQEETVINDNIAQAVDRYDNVHLIDWNALSQGNEAEWLYDDLTHLRPEGDAPYVDLITNAIAPSIVEAGGSYDPDPDVAAQWEAQQAQDAATQTSAQADAQAQQAQEASDPAVVYESDADRAAGIYAPLLIGDSVPGDTPFYDVFPDGYIDSYVGRRPLEAISVYQDYAAQGVVGDVVVFAAFSNTTPQPDQLDQLVAAVGTDKQIYLVGTVNPDGFQDAANSNLQACADAYDNVHYVDWPACVAGHEDEWLYDDGTHVTPEGGKAYLKMIAQAVGAQMVADGGSVVSEADAAAPTEADAQAA